MKKIIIPLLFLFVMTNALAQQEVEKEIRALEQMETTALVAKDSAVLLKLWDKDYTVNSPDNVIVTAGKNTLDRPALKRSRSSFTRNIEKIVIQGNTVFSMGSETVAIDATETEAAKTVHRRYTNIWMNKDNQWKLVARHANIICQKK